jgi:hypothetical protein
LCTYQSGSSAQTALAFCESLKEKIEINVLATPAAFATASGHAANLLLPGHSAVVDRGRCGVVDRGCTRFREVAGVWPLGSLVFLRRGLFDYLPLTLAFLFFWA